MAVLVTAIHANMEVSAMQKMRRIRSDLLR
jgi:hypothetical protein